MDLLEELDRLMSVDPDQGVSLYHEDRAMMERILEWLETPEGTVADLPAWGHILAPFKHEPVGENLAVIIEMAIIEKLPRDVRDLIVGGIRVEPIEMDMIRISILFQLGLFQRTFAISELQR